MTIDNLVTIDNLLIMDNLATVDNLVTINNLVKMLYICTIDSLQNLFISNNCNITDNILNGVEGVALYVHSGRMTRIF